MDWLRHFLPKTSDFLYPYAPDVESSTPEENETLPTKTGSAEAPLPISRERPRQGARAPEDVISKSPTIISDAPGYQDSVGHQQANAIDVGFSPNPSPPFRDPASDGHGQVLKNEPNGSKTVLEKMLKHIIPGAQYNSSARGPPPRCCPGTRTHILEDIGTRIQGRDTGVIWLFGLAGSGKSAVMQTLAETYSSSVTSATLFLSRDLRDDPDRLFITLAYDFAVANPSYRRFVGEEMALNPNLLSLSMAEQFKRLFIQPFLSHAISGTRRWVIFLDGLDECQSDASQCKIIDLIRDSILLYPEPIPLLWIISSRPETHLKASLALMKETTTGFWEKEVPINTPSAKKDIERYLRTELAYVSKNYSRWMPASPWPSEEEVLKLSDTCSGYFLFASSVVDYISGANAVSRLNAFFSPNRMLEQRPLTPSSFSGSGQEKRLHLTYTKAMSNIPKDVLPCTKAILGFYVLQQILPICSGPDSVGLESLDLLTVCNILGVEKHSAHAALHRISSLVVFPSPEEAGNYGIQFLHSSLSDFLRTYFLNLPGLTYTIWWCYVRILRQFKQKRERCGIHVSWPPLGELDGLQEALFQIARHGWLMFLIQCHYDRSSSRVAKIRFLESLPSRPADIFTEFGPDLIAYFAEPQIAEFIEWITKHAPSRTKQAIIVQVPSGIKQAIIVQAPSRTKKAIKSQHGPTSSSGLDMDKVFRKMSAQRYCCRIVTSSTEGTLTVTDINLTSGANPGVSEQSQDWSPSSIFGELATVRASGRDVFVNILKSSESDEECTIVGPITGCDSRGEVYYILPY